MSDLLWFHRVNPARMRLDARARAALAAFCLAATCALPAVAAHAPKHAAGSSKASTPTAAPAPVSASPIPTEATEVRVERVRPLHEKLPTLRFFKANRDFIRGRLDQLREQELPSSGMAAAIDPRYLTYQRMLAELNSGRDSLGTVEERRQRLKLLASVTQLGDLEARLDLLERLLADQRGRLGVLESDFAHDRQTAMMVVLSGYAPSMPLNEVRLTLDGGAKVVIPISAEQRDALAHGGVVQIFHGLIEPREQVIEVGIGPESGSGAGPGFLTLDPARDRLTLVRLDLSTLDPSRGASSLRAHSWLHPNPAPTDGG